MRRSPGTCGRCGGRWGRNEAEGLLVGAMVGAMLAGAPGGLAAQEDRRPPEQKVEERPRVPELERPTQEAGGAHEVRRGDTLWDLAGRYLSNPFDWPRIFQLNTDVVEDPHWIYPGERLRLPGAAPRDATDVAAPIVAPDRFRRQATGPREGVSGFGGRSIFDESPSSGSLLGELGVEELRPTPLVSASDFHRAPFLAEPQTLGPMAVTARKIEENPLDLSLPAAARRHHVVVLSLEGLSVEVGQVLQAVRWTRSLSEHGRVASPVALLEVTGVTGDSARATVVEVFGDYRVGDFAIPADRYEFGPSERLRPVEAGVVANLIGYEVEQVLLGRGDMVFLDVGSGAEVGIGDEFAVFPTGEARAGTADFEDRVAVVRVVRVQPGTSTAMVVDVQDVGGQPGASARLVHRADGG